MAIVSYVDDIFQLAKGYSTRNYAEIRENIINNKSELTGYCELGEEVYGYTITPNEALKNIYGFDFWVVRFSFSSMETLHRKEQQDIMEELFKKLRARMEEIPGYYHFRVPSHMVDVVKSFNNVMDNFIFCGGTVELITTKPSVQAEKNEEINIFFSEPEYIQKHDEILKKITYTSFETYQGQYHISPVTSEKAGLIYENWINNTFHNTSDEKVLIAEYQGQPIGFCTIREGEVGVEGILAAVSKEQRKLGAYHLLMSAAIDYAAEKGKTFSASTQFDNYISQGTWIALGMKPFYSFYNFHFNYTT